MNHNKALVIVDANRCFFPGEEGDRLGLPGFGELPVPNAQDILEPINELTELYASHELLVVTTGEAHPAETAHFSDTPNFINTWPVHGREGTPGALLHPELIAGRGIAKHFKKGDIPARTPAEDDSYTGALAHRYEASLGKDIKLPEYLALNGIEKVAVTGLTIANNKNNMLCVGSTARDLHELGFDVTAVTDAIKPLVEADTMACFDLLGSYGVHLATRAEMIVDISNTPEVVQR